MTPDTPDQQAWSRLHLAASTVVERIRAGQRLHANDLTALIAAVEDVDAVLFNDWWEREQAEKRTRKDTTHDAYDTPPDAIRRA